MKINISNSSTVCLELLSGAKVADGRTMKPVTGNEKKKMAGSLMSYFLFGEKKYKVKL